MTATAFLSRIARRPYRGARDEREDRLTEILAAVLAQPACRRLTLGLVRGWLAAAGEECEGAVALLKTLHGDDWDVRTATQVQIVYAGRVRRPDLEIRLEGPGSEVRIWIEAKIDAKPEREQVRDYVGALRDLRTPAIVLLLAPRQAYAGFRPEEIPPGVPRLTWQQTGALLHAYEPPGAVERFLVDGLIEYLHEEGLMDPDRVTPEHLVALSHHAEASRAVERCCGVAAAVLSGHGWSLQPGPAAPAQERTWTYGWPTADGVETGWKLRWILFTDSNRIAFAHRPGATRFTAGVGAGVGQLRTLAADTQDRLRQTGFELLGANDLPGVKFENIWRTAFPEDVLAGRSLEEQGSALGEWVHQTFSDITSTLAGAG